MWHMFSYKNEWHPYEMNKSEITMLNEISQVQKENTMLSSHILFTLKYKIESKKSGGLTLNLKVWYRAF